VPPPDADAVDPVDSVAINRAVWTAMNARYTDAAADARWRGPEITWGAWGIPEARLRVLPATLAGLDVVELGCGTAYLSAWLARRGARPMGVDPTPAQLATARRCQAVLGPPLTWADLALANGYADQAHLVREFRTFGARPPAHLFTPEWYATTTATGDYGPPKAVRSVQDRPAQARHAGVGTASADPRTTRRP
jgi:SAM-dependent methyltransferase